MNLHLNQVQKMVLLVILFFGLALAGIYFSNDAGNAKQGDGRDYLSDDYDVSLQSDRLGKNNRSSVDYYMLALSWSPGFCEDQLSQNSKLSRDLMFQCHNNNQFGWVTHGLWPQNSNARRVEDQPRFCQGDLPPVERELLEQYLDTSPGLRLLQGQWEKHGACAFTSAKAYFDKQQQLFEQLVLPEQEMSMNQVFNFLRKHNAHLAGKHFARGKNEVRICYDLNWRAMSCPRSLR